jgi:hypothetical protein
VKNPSFGAAAVRSYLPEALLRHQRDAKALYYKYDAKARGEEHAVRFGVMLTPDGWRQHKDVDLHRREDFKRIGNVVLKSDEESPVEAFDPVQPDVRINIYSDDALQMHIVGFSGATALRNDLANAATYISLHEDLRTRRLVAGTTFEPMARLALRAGFHPMWNEDIDGEKMYQLQLRQQVFNTLNNRDNPLNICTVYMSTDEFISRFAQQPAMQQQ